MTIPTAVTLDELVDLFTGVPDDNGSWATTPAYSTRLAYEICRRTDTPTVDGLRRHLYDDTPVEDIPEDALHAIKLGHERYRLNRQMQGARGL